MRITVSQLRRIIREVVESEMGDPMVHVDQYGREWLKDPSDPENRSLWKEKSPANDRRSQQFGDDRSTEDILGGGWRGRSLARDFEERW